MNRQMKRLAVPVGAALILGSSGFAFMAANSVPTTAAGEGSAAIVGYDVSNVHYEMGFGGGPGAQRIQSVSFDLNRAASEADAFVTSPAGGRTEYRTCTSGNGLSWVCEMTPNSGNTGADLDDASELTVAAVQ